MKEFKITIEHDGKVYGGTVKFSEEVAKFDILVMKQIKEQFDKYLYKCMSTINHAEE